MLKTFPFIFLTLKIVIAFKTSSDILQSPTAIYKCGICEKKGEISKEEVTEHLRETIIGINLAGKHLRTYKIEFTHRLHQKNFRAFVYSNQESWDESVLMYFLEVERSKHEDIIVDIEDMTTTMHKENITSTFTINIKYITNCTRRFTYTIISKLVIDFRRYEILDVSFKKTTRKYTSTWKSQNSSTPIPEHREFAKEFCGKLNFFEHFHDEDEFVGIAETDTYYKFGLPEFKEYLTIFFTKYHKTGNYNEYIMTKDNDHMVFQCEVALKFRDEPHAEFWTFDIEAIYRNNSQWHLAKVFLGHRFITNQFVFEREARYFGGVLKADIISQISGKTRKSTVDHGNLDEVGFQVEVFENNSTYVKVCPALLPHPHPQNRYLKVRLPKFVGRLHVYSEFIKRHLNLELYFPDDLGMRIFMSFQVVDHGVLAKFYTAYIGCPEISKPPTTGELEIIRIGEDTQIDEADELVDSSFIIT
ncbi:unnamed protein product [Caenorhabditis angaria]|uniref:DUF38 domain-containing protein n=1 Tax=Caenorhabditis angaria TaxID=860376 RepID=A0A9P1MXY8_9PELO|nr:unnamed protein product [Caenorhabditis angaria]